jgi:hypothetical protein
LQVAAGSAANGTAPVAAGNLTVAAATASQLIAIGLAPGRVYDVYLVAADSPAGNLQSAVLNFTYVLELSISVVATAAVCCKQLLGGS